MQPIDFEGELSKIVESDQRYDREAYVFLRQGLDFCHRSLLKAGKKKPDDKVGENHVTVAQLLDGLRRYALEEYGPMAATVLESWGVKSCADFGEIVFKLVEHSPPLLSITENDTREAFAKGYSFSDVFRAPFQPGKRRDPKPAAEPSAT